jgi:hypothetical protein
MDRSRFEDLLAAYGADFRRWPEDMRAAGEGFARDHAAEAEALLRDARELDHVLGLAAPDGEPAPELLVRRILKQAPKPQAQGFDRRALMALAACAVFGVVIGYGGGLFAPPPSEEDAYFSAAFAAPFENAPGDEG